ncbi:histidine acid [Fusarium sporotrichioides]|uniref:Histidine acid n=1 Tax=Fusarium sporotrichioides TaxID=5514 RepID=A0A395SI35_FUSSP|nr:histidine acid [Fusarium sporotrichioides]
MVLSKKLIAVLPLTHAVAAQSNKVWAAVAFINHGEITPPETQLRTVLTPEGAQQLWRQGTAFRARYIPDGVNNSDYENIQTAYLQDLNPDVIDNQALEIISQADEWVSGSALAFMQGFYPPAPNAFDDSTGGEDIAVDLVSSDNKTEYPLDGYQYPNVRIPSLYDPEYISVQGTSRCPAWYAEISANLTEHDSLDNIYQSSLVFYQDLFSTPPLKGTIDMKSANLENAYNLWQFVDYQYRHNETVYEELGNANGTLTLLNYYATKMERATNSYSERSDDNSRLGVLYSIAGRTLAYKIMSQFRSNIHWGSNYNKLTFMFGSIEPIVSFISISGLLTKDNEEQQPWSSLPEPGAALVFELFGEDTDSPGRMPSTDSLRVRMSYRASADADEPFRNQPIFKSGPDGIAYTRFVQIMNQLGTSPSEWCDICGPPLAPWCITSSSDDDTWDGDSPSSLGPIIAGIIGAVIAFTAMAVLVACLFVCAGFRIQRKPAPDTPPSTAAAVGGAAGGFKGPEKKDGDADVVVTKQGVHHERVGSWELRSPNEIPPQPQMSGVITKDFDAPRHRTMDDSDDDISVIGAAPVKARESI